MYSPSCSSPRLNSLPAIPNSPFPFRTPHFTTEPASPGDTQMTLNPTKRLISRPFFQITVPSFSSPPPLRFRRLAFIIHLLSLSDLSPPHPSSSDKTDKTLRILSPSLNRNPNVSRSAPQLALTKSTNFASPCGTPGKRDKIQKHLRLPRTTPNDHRPKVPTRSILQSAFCILQFRLHSFTPSPAHPFIPPLRAICITNP